MFEGADRNLAAMLPSLPKKACSCDNHGNRLTFTVIGESDRAVAACCLKAAAAKAGVDDDQLQLVLGPWEMD